MLNLGKLKKKKRCGEQKFGLWVCFFFFGVVFQRFSLVLGFLDLFFLF